jgi:hypothetical protein
LSSIADTFDFSRTNAVHLKWVELRFHESYREGDEVRARKLGTPPPFSNRHAPRAASAMLLQLQFIARPVLLQFTRFIDDRNFTNSFVRYLHENRAYWMEQQKSEGTAPVFLDDPSVPGLVERSVFDLSEILLTPPSPSPTVNSTIITTYNSSSSANPPSITHSLSPSTAEVANEHTTAVTTIPSTTSPTSDLITVTLPTTITTTPTAAPTVDMEAIHEENETLRARLGELEEGEHENARLQARLAELEQAMEAQRVNNRRGRPNELALDVTFSEDDEQLIVDSEHYDPPRCLQRQSNASVTAARSPPSRPPPSRPATPHYAGLFSTPARSLESPLHVRPDPVAGGADQTLSILTSPRHKVIVRIPSSLANLSPTKKAGDPSTPRNFNVD